MTDPRKLRRTGPWQVLVIEPPKSMEHLGVVGLALVLDTRADKIRGAAPMQSLAELPELVLQAAVAPPGDCKPARPRSIQCQAQHAARLADVGRRLGCSVQPTGNLGAARAAADQLAEYLSPREAGLPVTPVPWGQLNARLFANPPWGFLDDGVEFHFRSSDASLDGRVALVLGLAGQQYGFSIFPSEESHWRFRNRSQQGPRSVQLVGIEALMVHFDPPSELPKSFVAAARQAGLVYRGQGGFELVQTLFALKEQQLGPMTPGEEFSAAGVVEAVLEMWRRCGTDLVGEGGEERIQLSDGRSVVVTVPVRFGFAAGLDDDEALPLFEEYAHLAFSGTGPGGVPTLIFKYAKAHALKVAGWIEGIERVRVEGGMGQPLRLFGDSAVHDYGLLLVLEPDHPISHLVTGHSAVELIVSSGGAKRRSFNPKDIVFQTTVTVEGAAAAGGVGEDDFAATFDFDTLDPDGVLGGKDWSGAPDSWPKASAALMAFGAPMELDGAPVEVADVMYRLLAMIWNAVVAADFMGMPNKVELVRALELPLPIPDAIDKLVARKRACFPRDNRVLKVTDVTVREGDLHVGVDWVFGTPES